MHYVTLLPKSTSRPVQAVKQSRIPSIPAMPEARADPSSVPVPSTAQVPPLAESGVAPPLTTTAPMPNPHRSVVDTFFEKAPDSEWTPWGGNSWSGNAVTKDKSAPVEPWMLGGETFGPIPGMGSTRAFAQMPPGSNPWRTTGQQSVAQETKFHGNDQRGISGQNESAAATSIMGTSFDFDRALDSALWGTSNPQKSKSETTSPVAGYGDSALFSSAIASSLPSWSSPAPASNEGSKRW